jgi:hypothetical protein
MKGKTKFAFAVVILSLIIVSILGISIASLTVDLPSRAVVGFATALALAILFAVILRKVYSDMKTEVPSEDEREKKARLYAAGYSYFVSLFLWLGIMFVRNYLTSEQLILAGLFGMSLVFIVLWWHFSSRGNIA